MQISHASYAGFTLEVKNPAILDLEIEMVTSKKPAVTKPVDQSISLIKTLDKKEVATQKTVAKGSVEKKAEKISEKKAPTSTSTAKETKTAKPAAKPLANKKESPKKAADTETADKRTAKKTESPRVDRPTSAWPFPSSDSES
jgi:hypothetical protein